MLQLFFLIIVSCLYTLRTPKKYVTFWCKLLMLCNFMGVPYIKILIVFRSPRTWVSISG
jgi:hypothetical protein